MGNKNIQSTIDIAIDGEPSGIGEALHPGHHGTDDRLSVLQGAGSTSPVVGSAQNPNILKRLDVRI